MTELTITMEPESTTLRLDNVTIRATDRDKQPGVYVIFLDISDSDAEMWTRYGKRLTPKKSKQTGRWYYVGYLGAHRMDCINGCRLYDGGEYFIPSIEYILSYPIAGRPPEFRIMGDGHHRIHAVKTKTDISKEETKMATYDEKTGKRYYDYTQASAAYRSAFGIDKVVYSPPATIVFWKDGSKTVVKCSENDVFDPLAGIAFALMRKVYGKEYRSIEKYAKEYEKLHPAVDISAMALDSLLDDLADTALAGYTVSGKEYEAIVGNTPAKKVGETTVDDSELKPMDISNVGGEMVKKALEDLAKEVTDDGAHE